MYLCLGLRVVGARVTLLGFGSGLGVGRGCRAELNVLVSPIEVEGGGVGVYSLVSGLKVPNSPSANVHRLFYHLTLGSRVIKKKRSLGWW